MIQALRDLIDLYTFYFDILERFLDKLDYWTCYVFAFAKVC